MAISMQTAFTTEIDDVDDALEELFSQISFDALQQNSLAVVNCYYDFFETGIYSALVEKLPFDVVGCTSMASATQNDLGQYRLNLTILTSDDVSFATAVTKPLVDEHYAKTIAAGFDEARAALGKEPTMLLTFFPMSFTLSASDMLSALDTACKEAPVFGSLPSGINMNYDGCRTFLNDDVHTDALVLALFSGNFEPRFTVTHIPDRNIRQGRFTVTESEGCVLRKVNDTPVLDYLNSLGLYLSAENRTTIPFILYPSGSHNPVATAVYAINDDGSLLLGAPAPIGMMMAIGEIDSEGILSTGQDNLDALLKDDKSRGVLLTPCITRYIMLAPNQDDEMVAVNASLYDKMPYALHYAGGEVCPIKGADGRWHNQFHNFSLPVCVF
ncbi:MAG: FIST C-terminal domain-containing protein [Coriobacteriales bacterium]|jgi:hypothetical protein|nr:FIST C-terminal domain-containing protein [Coriobacteriales bacterium]